MLVIALTHTAHLIPLMAQYVHLNFRFSFLIFYHFLFVQETVLADMYLGIIALLGCLEMPSQSIRYYYSLDMLCLLISTMQQVWFN